MLDRQTPRDAQSGDPLSGPYRFDVSQMPGPQSVCTVGLDPEGYLQRGVLWEVFGIPHVAVCSGNPLDSTPAPDAAVLVRTLPSSSALSWDAFVDWLGPRRAVVDLRAAVSMANVSGIPLTVASEGTRDAKPVQAYNHNTMVDVYPGAPRIQISLDTPESIGFTAGDEFHFYERGKNDLMVLEHLANDAGFHAFSAATRACVWGVSAASGAPALLTIATPSGGRITLMDLGAVDRMPEPSGVETLAVQLLLNGLGKGTSVFGKFCITYPKYGEFLEAVRALVAEHATVARLEQIGSSTLGRPIWILKVNPSAAKQAVLLTTAIHSLEWGPIYGVLRYIRFLLNEASNDTPYARDVLGLRSLWWVLCTNPDGWETRDQEATGINLNRNFPGSWEKCLEDVVCWDTYNARFVPVHPGALKARGPAPGSEAEVRTLMNLLQDGNRQVAAMADFHETTAPHSFLHQHEQPSGVIPDLAHHRELVEGLAQSFNGRFWAHMNVMAYGPLLSDFSTYKFQPFVSLPRLVPGSVSGWQGYAVHHGVRAPLVEVAGGDCTHYQTIRRTEYAALAAEQVLAAENGRLLRNPFPDDREMSATLHRRPNAVCCRVFDAAGELVLERREQRPQALRETIPPGGWVRLTHGA